MGLTQTAVFLSLLPWTGYCAPFQATKQPLFSDAPPSYLPLSQTINYYGNCSESKTLQSFVEGTESQQRHR